MTDKGHFGHLIEPSTIEIRWKAANEFIRASNNLRELDQVHRATYEDVLRNNQAERAWNDCNGNGVKK